VQAFDTLAPAVSISDNKTDVTINSADGDITYTITFTQAVTGFNADAITVVNGLKGDFTAISATEYTLVVTPDAAEEGDITIDVAAGMAFDTNGNPNTAATQAVQAFDTLAPVPTITLDANITADDTIKISEVSDSIAITGHVGSDAKVGDWVTLTVNDGVNGDKTFTGQVKTGMVFSINVSGADLAEDADRRIEASITTSDGAGNPGTAIDPDGESYTVDLTNPGIKCDLHTSNQYKLDLNDATVSGTPAGASNPDPAMQARRETITGTDGDDTIDHNAAFSSGESQWTKTLHITFTEFTKVTSVEIGITDDISGIVGFDLKGLTGTGVTRGLDLNGDPLWSIIPGADGIPISADLLRDGLDINIIYNIAETPAAVDFSANVTVEGESGSLVLSGATAVNDSLSFSWRDVSDPAAFGSLPLMVLPSDGVGVEILAGAGNDMVHAGAGDDLVYGEAGIDSLYGGLGNDTLIGGAGGDYLNGGNIDIDPAIDGNDTASYANASAVSGTTGVFASLADSTLNTGDAVEDSYISIENLTGSDFDDTLTGDAGINVLSGGAGNDTLIGGAGNDTLQGGGDTLSGAGSTLTGGDTASYANAGPGGIIASLTTGLAGITPSGDAAGDTYIDIENLTGSNGDDTLIGNASNNIISGGEGNDILEGMDGADRLEGGSGRNTASYMHATEVIAGIGITASLATPADNTGHAADDSYSNIQNLTGSNFADTLTGDDGDNILSG
ncbi:MAG: Ig-like domain-containing protein, partial [Desulfuromonadaceae bacterium]